MTQGKQITTPERLEEATVMPRRTPPLHTKVTAFVEDLAFTYPERMRLRPAVLKKRVMELVRHIMPPHPKRTGKPMSPRVTDACRLLAEQDREMAQGRRHKRDWLVIAKKCIPGFERIRSIKSRSDAIRRLQNAVSQRLARQRQAHKRRNASSQQQPV